MATVPLIRNKNDMYYRYQMPKLIAKIEGSGNGIRTVITNMSLIAKAINRPAAYITKFFGYELGAQVKTESNIYSVNGSHDAEKLLSLLYSFIEKFILCSSCENPETDLSVVKKAISLKCKACGATTNISERTHRLTTFIANHAEDSKSSSKKDAKKKDKSGKKGEEKSGKKSGSDQKDSAGRIASAGGDDDDGFDESGEELKPDLNILADEFKTSVKIDSADILEKFYQLIKEKADGNLLGDVKIQKDLVNEATNLGIRDKSTLALCKALFDENIVEQINTHNMILLRFCHGSPKAQKYLLGGIERIIELFPKLLQTTAKILKEFYDKDVLDEEVLIEWYEKPSKKYVSKDLAKQIREKAFPLIKWLKEADVEDDSDDDTPAVNNGSAKPTTTTTTTKPETNGNGNGNAKDDDNDDEEEDDEIGFSHRVSGIKVETVVKGEDKVDDDFIDAI